MTQPRPASPAAETAVPAPIARDPRVAVEAPSAPVRAGAPFTIVLRSRVSRDAAVAFPVGPDSGAIEALASAETQRVAVGPDSADVVTTYRLVAWETGVRLVPFGEAVFEQGGRVERVPVGGVPVQVASVLPGEGTPEPKPARAPFESASRWIGDALAVTLALLVGALLVWWAMRRRGTAAAPVAAPRGLDPAAALSALEGLALERAGEPARVLIGAGDVVRLALAREHPRTRTLTTRDLAGESFPGVPMAPVLALLQEADAARFGRAPVTPERARQALAQARQLIAAVAGAGVVDRVGGRR